MRAYPDTTPLSATSRGGCTPRARVAANQQCAAASSRPRRQSERPSRKEKRLSVPVAAPGTQRALVRPIAASDPLARLAAPNHAGHLVARVPTQDDKRGSAPGALRAKFGRK